MTFAHPALLSLVALAALPPAIHWLIGRWAPVEPWAAMRFLTAETPVRKRAEWRDRAVMAARALALALAAIAAAGPRAASVGDGARLGADDPPTLHVVVLDDSLSTARPRGDGPAFASLQRAALERAERVGPADRFALIRAAKADPISGPPRTLGPIGASEYRRAIAAAEPLNTAADAPAALAAAADLLDEQADRFPAARVTLLTDHAAADWGDAAVLAGVERIRAAGRGGNAVRWAGPPGPGPAGRTLVALSASADDPDPRLAASPRVGAPAELQATVRTFGPRPAGAVAFFVNDRFVGRAPLPASDTSFADAADLAPNDATVAVSTTFRQAGPARVTARLEGEPGPAALTTRFAVVPVRDRVRIAIAADRSLLGEGPAGDPAFYLEQALAADTETFDLTRLSLDALATRDLSAFDAVAVVGAPPEPAAAALRAYLNGGGGAFLTLRPTDDPAALRTLFDGPLGGIAVGSAEGVADPLDPAAVGFTFAFPRDDSPLAPLKAVDGPRGGLVVGFRQLEETSTVPPGAWPVRIAARFADEDDRAIGPAVLTASGPTGGRFAALATSADATWGGPWPAAGASFVPLVRGLTAFVALPPPPESATTGALLTDRVPSGRFVPSATLVRPDGDARLVPVEDGVATATATGEPGFYRLRLNAADAAETDTGVDAGAGAGVGGEAGRWIAVNAPPSEADPRPTETAAPEEPTTTAPPALAESRSLSAWIWAAALGVLLIEPLLARGRRTGRR